MAVIWKTYGNLLKVVLLIEREAEWFLFVNSKALNNVNREAYNNGVLFAINYNYDDKNTTDFSNF